MRGGKFIFDETFYFSPEKIGLVFFSRITTHSSSPNSRDLEWVGLELVC
jgi:hypothetical protein